MNMESINKQPEDTIKQMNQEKVKKVERYEPEVKERYWQDFWERTGVYHFDPESDKPLYTIDTPPPTISGSLHLGHIFSYTQAEIIARYKRMSGFNVRYPIGMDNNGLPTERLVEKEKGIKGGRMALKDFVDICLEVTKKYQTEYENLWKSVGLSVDWRLEYSTISPEVQKLSQTVFKELFEKDLIYKKNAPALFCVECQTSFAQAEKEDKEKEAVFYDLAFTKGDGQELIISTTRPELLPACVAVFVNPSDPRYTELVGQEVTTPLGDTVKIIADEKVELEKGSGAVMCCTYGDETDIFWAKKYSLPEKIIISKNGRMIGTDNFNSFDGQKIQEGRATMVEELKRRGAIKAEKPINHNVDVHERCGTPVEFLTTTQWFLKLADMKEQLKLAADKINWHPEHMKKRFDEWVDGLKWDWCISRERFYGVPIPAFNCDSCDYVQVPEVDKFPIDPKLETENPKCPKCNVGNLVPEKDVFDTWFTSSLTPEINNQNIANGRLTNKMPELSMRPQAHDIIRTWALYTILMSLYRNNEVPWSDLMISGHIMVSKGEKISKKTGGGKFKPQDLIKQHSADAVRYSMSGVSLGRDAYFDEKELEKGKKLAKKIFNAGRLVLGNLKDFNPTTQRVQPEQMEATDKWIIDRSFEVGDETARDLDDFNFSGARNKFEDFFWREFCDNYLEMVKKRLYEAQTNPDSSGVLSAKYACYQAFLNIIKMASPFVPHITEELFHAYLKDEVDGENKNQIMTSDSEHGYFSIQEGVASVHATAWPHKTGELSDPDIRKGAELVLQAIGETRKYKSAQSIRMGQEIPNLIISCDKEKQRLLKPFMNDLASTVRVIKIDFVENTENMEANLAVIKI